MICPISPPLTSCLWLTLGSTDSQVPSSDGGNQTMSLFEPLIKGLVNIRKVVWEGGILRRLTLLIASGHINTFSVHLSSFSCYFNVSHLSVSLGTPISTNNRLNTEGTKPFNTLCNLYSSLAAVHRNRRRIHWLTRLQAKGILQ